MNQGDFIDYLKADLIGKVTDSLFELIISKVAFLAWGPLAPIIKYILKRLLVLVFYKTELAAFFLYIDVRTDSQGRDYYNAITKNLEAKTPEEKLNAEKNLKDAFRALAKLSN